MFFEAMKWIAVGVLVGAGGLVLSAIVGWALDLIGSRHIRREERERAKRMNDEAYRRYMRGLAVALLAVALGGCGDDGPTTPTPVVGASPSPSPSPTPTPIVDRCKPTTCAIQGDRVVIGLGALQERTLLLLVLDAFRTPIDNACAFSREATWSHNGPIRRTGDRDGYAFSYWAEAPGNATVSATVGNTIPSVKCSFDITIRE